jgi:hypothetical protein
MGISFKSNARLNPVIVVEAPDFEQFTPSPRIAATLGLLESRTGIEVALRAYGPLRLPITELPLSDSDRTCRHLGYNSGGHTQDGSDGSAWLCRLDEPYTKRSTGPYVPCLLIVYHCGFEL